MLVFCQCGGIKGQCGCKTRTARKTTKERGYGNDWRKLSEAYRASQPLCEDCLGRDKVKPCTEVHHIEPISKAPHLRLEPSNLVVLCKECHEQRHQDPQGA